MPRMLQKRVAARKSRMLTRRRRVATVQWLMKTYMCLICGFIYDEEEGDPEAGIVPGTRWDDVPLSWRCPDCGAGKEDFEMVEV